MTEEHDISDDDTHTTPSPTEGKLQIMECEEHNMGIDTLHRPMPNSIVDSLISMEEIPNGMITAKSLSTSKKLLASTW